MQVVEALIAVMAVTWLAAATLLVLLWRQVQATERSVAQQRLLLELRVMRARFRHHAPEVDPTILGEDGDGTEAGSLERETAAGAGVHDLVAEVLEGEEDGGGPDGSTGPGDGDGGGA